MTFLERGFSLALLSAYFQKNKKKTRLSCSALSTTNCQAGHVHLAEYSQYIQRYPETHCAIRYMFAAERADREQEAGECSVQVGRLLADGEDATHCFAIDNK
jgi:hypothetical protein